METGVTLFLEEKFQRGLRDRDNATGIGDNSAEIGDGSAEIGDSSAEIGDDAAGIVDIAANVIPSRTSSWMETGVTLFLEDKFQSGFKVWPNMLLYKINTVNTVKEQKQVYT